MTAPFPSLPELQAFLQRVDARKGEVHAVSSKGMRVDVNPAQVSVESREELASLIQRPPPGMVIFKFGSRSIVGGFSLTGDARVVLKYYYPRSPVKHLTYGIRGSRARQSWISALALNYAGIPTPPAILLAETVALGGLWLERSLLVTGHASGITLQKWVQLHTHDRIRLDAMARRLGTLFSRLAHYRIGHGDLKATNLLVDEADSLSLVDLDATVILAEGPAWAAGRRRDERIFQANWKTIPTAAAAFASVFPTTAAS